MDKNIYEVTYTVRVAVTKVEVEEKRRQAKAALFGGAFNRDSVVEKLIASGKALEAIGKQDPETVKETIKLIDSEGFNTSEVREFLETDALRGLLVRLLAKDDLQI